MDSIAVAIVAVLSHPIGGSVFVLVVKALRDDWKAFKAFESFGEAKQYRYDVVAWKVLRSAVEGIVAGFGLWLTQLGLGTIAAG